MRAVLDTLERLARAERARAVVPASPANDASPEVVPVPHRPFGTWAETLALLPPAVREALEERAAILEHEAGLPRERAEWVAFHGPDVPMPATPANTQKGSL